MDKNTALLMQQFFVASARGLVEAQMALDEHGRASIITWEQDGQPPTVWTWAGCRLRFPVSFHCTPKTFARGKADLTVAPRHESPASITFTFRYLLALQDEDENTSYV